MITIPNDILFKQITKNLDVIIENDLEKTYQNIKNISIISHLIMDEQFNIINDIIPITESEFLKFFTDGIGPTINILIQSMFVTGDAIIGTLTSGSISSFTINSLSSIMGYTAANALVGFAPFFLLFSIYVIYKKINNNNKVITYKLFKCLTKLSQYLKVPINSRLNTEFRDLLKNKCKTIKNKNLRMDCAMIGYIKFLNEFVLVDLIKSYIKFLVKNNENIEDIKSFQQLAMFKSQSNKTISDLMNTFYSLYIRFLNGLRIEKSIISDSFNLLNRITISQLKVNY